MSEKAGEIISIILLIFYATMAGIVGVAIFIDVIRRIIKCSKNKYLKSETAKEIFQRLYSMRDIYGENVGYEIRLTEDNFKELCKQYGVEE